MEPTIRERQATVPKTSEPAHSTQPNQGTPDSVIATCSRQGVESTFALALGSWETVTAMSTDGYGSECRGARSERQLSLHLMEGSTSLWAQGQNKQI